MNVHIETHRITMPRQLRSTMQSKIYKAMQRFSHQIQQLRFTLKDVNGAKGGTDKVCTVKTNLVHGGEIIVSKRGNNAAQAVYRALQSIKNKLPRQISRRRHYGNRTGLRNQRFAAIEVLS